MQAGMREGFKRGKEAQRQIARQMRAAGLSAQDIASYTGLSVEEVETL